MPSPLSPIVATPGEVDFETDGRRAYRVALADDSGRNGQLLPLAVIRNGAGPSVLVAGGTHGDEFEGQIAVSDLIRNTEASDVSGLLVALPLHNFPACLAGARTGPEDGADLNRLFRKDIAQEGPSMAIASFVASALLPPVDWVVDLHSGGVTHDFVLSSNLQAGVGSSEYDGMLPALMAFDAPYAIVFDEVGGTGMPHTGTLEGLARQMGKRAVSSEIGGGGRATPASLSVAAQGLRNILAHIGVRPHPDAVPPGRSRSQLFALSRREHYVPTPAAGRLAPACWLGDEVRAGDTLGHIHPLEDPFSPPLPIPALSDGVVVAVASVGVQQEGASVFFIAEHIA